MQGASEGLTLVPGEGGEVVVVDSVGLSSLSSPTAPPCDVSSLLSALTYWCQGKPGGCSPPACLSVGCRSKFDPLKKDCQRHNREKALSL